MTDQPASDVSAAPGPREATPENEDRFYKGLRMRTLPGLHPFIATKAQEYFAPAATVLDVAAGTGAMSLRLQDLGFAPTATDYFTDHFQLDAVPFVRSDLNEAFSAEFPRPFQAIVASEIIEHLENPWHFARECYALLSPGGRMVLTTPNCDNPGSKASFLRTGQFLWFSEQDYAGPGHITPLTQWQIQKAFGEAGFRFLWQGSFGEGASLLRGSPRMRLVAWFVQMLSSLNRRLGGEIYVAVLERPAATGHPAA